MSRKLLFALIFVIPLLFSISREAHAGVITNRSVYLSVNSGLVGYWTFDGNHLSGTTASDQSGNGNSGTLTNGPVASMGKIGQALSFDGENDVVDAASPATLDNLGPMTVSAWIRPMNEGEGNSGAVVFKGTATDGNGFWRFALTSTNAIQFVKDHATTDLTRTTSNNTIMREAWQHVAVTWDGNSTAIDVRIYVNGAEASYQTTTNGAGAENADAALSLFVGNDSAGGVTFNGSIDDVRVYNRALSNAEITRVYKGGL